MPTPAAAIGQAATTGQSSYLQMPANAAPLFIAIRRSDGAVFFMEYNTHRIGVIDPAAATPSDTSVIEFYNTLLNHYFVTANAGEAAGIDAGAAGPGWSRTGETWRAWLAGPLPNAAEVCRFYGTIEINPATGQRWGPNSHFYTLEAPECAVRQTRPRLDLRGTKQVLAAASDDQHCGRVRGGDDADLTGRTTIASRSTTPTIAT